MRLSKSEIGARTNKFGPAIIFVLLLPIYEYLVLMPDYDRQMIPALYSRSDILGLLKAFLLSTISIILTVGICHFALHSRIAGRVFYFVGFAIALSVEYAHHLAFNSFSHYTTAAVGFYAGDLSFSVKALAMYFNAACLPPIVIFLYFLTLKAPARQSATSKAALSVLVIIFAVLSAYMTGNRYVTVSPWAFLRTAIGFPVNSFVGWRGRPPARTPIQQIAHAQPSNNIVFIVDESVRGDHLSLNGYEANKIAALEPLAVNGRLANFGIASAGSTCSESSNNLLLTGLAKLPDTTQSVHKFPTIFQYARAMGYKTFDFDGQVSRVWKGDTADLKDIERRQTPVDFAAGVKDSYEIDGEIARRVGDIISTSTGNFIWINKRGVHKPYTDSYPQSSKVVEDSWYVGYDQRISKQQLVRNYDAAMRFNLNLFFDELFRHQIPTDSFFIYTSDHGQSLRDGGALASHCGTSRSEAIVPLFIFGSGVDARAFDTGYRASHANIFPTLLDLMKVPQGARPVSYAVSLTRAKAADSRRRYYAGADLAGVDDEPRNPFDPAPTVNPGAKPLRISSPTLL